MSEEILINITPIETRVAMVENGVLQEVFVERERSRGLVGNIYLGKVVRTLPGMQAAFVDIGMQKASYIHVNDIYQESAHDSQVKPLDISQVAKEGQTMLVQVTKDPIGTKGARLSSFLSVSSRNLVYMPQSDHIGVSSKIDDETLREHLKSLLENALVKVCEDKASKQLTSKNQKGYIIRTAAESSNEDDFLKDIRYLNRLWAALERKVESMHAPCMIYEELHLSERVMRDNVYPELEKIRVDSEPMYERLINFAGKFIPEYVEKIEEYRSERPIFDLFSVEEEIEKALSRKVELKSGGSLIIDQTEALTTIDVNTGAYVGKRNLAETIFKTNLEAATALARQLRLRNLGGMVLVDFIDMEVEEHQRQVLRILEKATMKDRAKVNIGEFSGLGLVEMTRKRTRESLEHTLCEICTVCNARGTIRSAETVCSDIFREILRAARTYEHDKLMVIASQPVVDRLLDEDSVAVAGLQELLGKSIQFQVDSIYTQEQYDVVFL